MESVLFFFISKRLHHVFFLPFLDLVADVYQLGQCISDGRADKAGEMAKKLAKQFVSLEPKSGKNNEAPIQYVETIILLIFFMKSFYFSHRIRVKFDSNEKTISTKYKEQEMTVYPSTTIGELRSVVSL